MHCFRSEKMTKRFRPFRMEPLEQRLMLNSTNLDSSFRTNITGLPNGIRIDDINGGDDVANCVAVQADGKIVVGGLTSFNPNDGVHPAGLYGVVMRYNFN